MIPPRVTSYRSRRSNSSRLHRTMLDLYAKRRLLPAPLRLSLAILAAILLCFTLATSTPIRATTASALRRFSSTLHPPPSPTQPQKLERPKHTPVTHILLQNSSKPRDNTLSPLDYHTARRLPKSHIANKHPLTTPAECALWRKIAHDTTQVHPYRSHFTSLDVIDWFLYISLFDELFHQNATQLHKRPVYLDIAANHARKWSATWFFDRCMGWDGVCVEANPKYHHELHTERHCHVVETCVSDRERTVRFSMTNAYGGVVKEGTQQFGVDGNRHAHDEKFKAEFGGIKELVCKTVKQVGKEVGVEHYDFLSLDVEGHELPVLKGIDWERTRIDVIVTEGKSQTIRSLLEGLGYVLYKDVLKDWIYIRRESGLSLKPSALALMKRLDRATYKFTSE